MNEWGTNVRAETRPSLWMNEWTNEWINEWMNEWMNECVNEWMRFDGFPDVLLSSELHFRDIRETRNGPKDGLTDRQSL